MVSMVKVTGREEWDPCQAHAFSMLECSVFQLYHVLGSWLRYSLYSVLPTNAAEVTQLHTSNFWQNNWYRTSWTKTGFISLRETQPRLLSAIFPLLLSLQDPESPKTPSASNWGAKPTIRWATKMGEKVKWQGFCHVPQSHHGQEEPIRISPVTGYTWVRPFPQGCSSPPNGHFQSCGNCWLIASSTHYHRLDSDLQFPKTQQPQQQQQKQYMIWSDLLLTHDPQ